MAEVNVKILTFGGATQDVFLTGKALHARRDVRSRDYVEQLRESGFSFARIAQDLGISTSTVVRICLSNG